MEKMCSFVSVTQILNFVSEHNKNAGFKEFRELITKILSSYSNFTSILYSTRSLLTNAILEDEHYFQTLNLKGELLNSNKCDLCKKEFKEEQGKKEVLMVFNCNHIIYSFRPSKYSAATSSNSSLSTSTFAFRAVMVAVSLPTRPVMDASALVSGWVSTSWILPSSMHREIAWVSIRSEDWLQTLHAR